MHSNFSEDIIWVNVFKNVDGLPVFEDVFPIKRSEAIRLKNGDHCLYSESFEVRKKPANKQSESDVLTLPRGSHGDSDGRLLSSS